MSNILQQKLNEFIEISKIFGEKLVNIKDEIVKPSSFYKGENFEQYVEDLLFPERFYTLVRRTDNYERNLKRFSESTFDPDFTFRCRKTNFEFSVEAKYRTSLDRDNRLSWSKLYQMERYKQYDQNIHPVFIVVGLKGVSEKPKEIYLFPIKHRKNQYVNLNMEVAEKYKLESINTPVLIDHLDKILNF